MVNYIIYHCCPFQYKTKQLCSLENDNFAGAYMPLTAAGNIVFDGVVASCYASTDHDLAQIVMFLMRWFPTMVEWILGQDKESSAYVNILTVIGEWVPPFTKFTKN